MDEAFLHKDGPFAIPDFQFKPGLDEGAHLQALKPLPLLSHTQTEWPGELAFLDREDFLEENSEGPWPETASVSRIESPPPVSTITEYDDVWDLPLRDIDNVKPKPKRTWEHVADPAFQEPCKYLTELGPRAFDLALRLCVPEERTVRSVKPDIFLKSLYQLGLGRESVLFFAQDNGQFAWRIDEARITGLSSPVTKSVVEAFMQCGYYFRRLRKMVASVYRKRTPPPAVIAFAQLTGDLLTELEGIVTERQPVKGILQLQDAFKLPFKILTLLDDLFVALRQFDSDQDALSCLFEVAEEVERSEISLIGIMQNILEHVSKPWLEAVDACVGSGVLTAKNFKLQGLLESSMDWGASLNDENMFDEAFPRFFSLTDRRLVLQIFQGMKVLSDQGKHHQSFQGVDGYTGLKWIFTWKALANGEKISPPAARRDDQKAAEDTIESITVIDGVNHSDDPVSMLQNSCALIEANPRSRKNGGAAVKTILRHVFDMPHIQTKLSTEPSLETSAFSSFKPQLTVRARTVNRMCLEVLFDVENFRKDGESLNLSYHLNILHRYVLMHHGMFTTRLCHALFDPSLSSTERDEGTIRSGQMGLRLGSRTNWPPASSELQLALAGILGTSFLEDDPSWPKSRMNDLPGKLSFALRQLSDEEIDRCLDPDSLEALDFLKIRYIPPRPLDVVILPDALEKYDQILKLLLRLQRLVFVANHSFRPPRASAPPHPAFTGPVALRFAHAARHFVTAFSDYVVTSAISHPWAKFAAEIHALEAGVREGTTTTTTAVRRPITEQHGIAHIRRLHAAALDAMLAGCLLRRRQAKVRDVLDGALRLVLRFAALRRDLLRRQEEEARERDGGGTGTGGAGVYTDDRENSERTVADLYARFRKQVALLVQVCRGLAAAGGGGGQQERGGDGDGDGDEYRDEGEESGLGALVARLTMNDFYTDKHTR